jgi:hypothetical protein
MHVCWWTNEETVIGLAAAAVETLTVPHFVASASH